MTHKRTSRIIALLLALASVVSLIPTIALSADSPESTISLNSITWSSGTYQSAYFQRPCQIQDFRMNVGGQVLSGFCGDHSLHLNNRHIGDTWSTPQEVDNAVVKTMMAYYYTHLLGEDYWNDACISKGFNYVVSGDAILQYNGWIQEVVWMWSTDQIPSDYAGQVEMVAQAYRESFDARNGTTHASIDDQIVSDNPNTFRSVTELILSNTDAWCECPVYRYVHPDSDVQPILVGYPKKVTRVSEKYKVTVKKVDALNPSLTLGGARFTLESVTDDSFDTRNGTTASTTGAFVFEDLPAGTYKITEVSAPTGYTIDSAGPDYVTLPNNGENSVTKVFTDTPTITVSGSIRKVDKDNPTTGLAGATIAIQGVDNSFYGEYQTGSSGSLEGLDWGSLTTGSYKAWEIGAPEGYTLDSSDVKMFRIDANNSDVKLVFMDDAKVKVQLLKLDASGSPLSGAVFNVIRDGQVIASEATNASGQITVSNVTEGMYAFVEVSAPEGYAKLDEPVLAYVDQAAIQGGGTVSVAAVDKKLPDLTIEKKDGKTGAAVPGTVFEVKGIHFGFHEDVTTGNDGTTTLTGIPVDSYEVTEKSVPDPYVLGDEPAQTVWLGGGDHRTLIFTNLKEPLLTVKKIDAADSAPVPGTVFSVEGVDNRYKADWTMGTDGSYSLHLEPGSYKITEKSVPEPYCLDAEHNTQTVSLSAGDEKELVFKNQKKPQLTVKKIDAASGAPVPGTVFSVQGVDNRYKADWTMEAGGSYTLRLEPGSYKVTEKSVPEPYCLDENNVQTISLAAGDEKELVFENQKKPHLTVKKSDAADNAPVPGTVFSVQGVDNRYKADWTMGTDGSYSLRLEPGSYKITEKSVPEPYCLDENNVQTISLAAGDEKELVFKNQKNPLLTISKSDAEDGRPVPGTVFTVEGINNRYKSDWTTGNTGSASERLDPGSYRVTEKSVPAPYYLPEKAADRVQTISLSAGDEKELVFHDHKMPTLTIYKEDSVAGAPIEGTQFHVTYTSNGESAEAPESYDFGTLYTDDKGEIRLHETGVRLYPGEYTVTETKAAKGFQMKEPTTQRVIIHGSESKTLTFQNEPLNAIIVEKYDSVTGQAIGGATFRLKALRGLSGTGGTVIGTKTTGTNGTAIWTGLDSGTYIVEEVSPAPGYNILQTSETVYLANNGEQTVITVAFYNAPDGSVLIKKIDSVTHEPLSDVEFLVTDANGAFVGESNGKYVTNSGGVILIEGLTPETAIVVRETRTRPGYILDDTPQTITVKAGKVNTLEFRDQPKGTLIIQKQDKSSRTPLAGAEFRVTMSNTDLLEGNEGLTQSSYVTDQNGQIILTKLTPGAYIVTEVKAPENYKLDLTPQTVEVKAAETKTVVFNDEVLASLTILKRDSVSRLPLAGAEFTITDGNGGSIGRYTTGDDGTVTITGLQPNSTVIVTEVSAPAGYVRNSTPKNIRLRSGTNNSLTFDNEPTTTLLIHKYVDGTRNEPIAGVEFKVTDSTGAVIGPDNGVYTTDRNGEIKITGLVPGTTIIARETKAAEGYVLDGTPQEIMIKAGEVQTLTYWNKKPGTLIIRKLDSETRKPLEGVEFKVTYADGKAADTAGGRLSSNGQYFTDRNGEITITGIVGTFIVTEVNTIPGYVIDESHRQQTVVVNPDDTQTITLFNPPSQTLIVQKFVTGTSIPIQGAEFLITDSHGTVIGQSNGEFVTDAYGRIVLNDLTPGVTIVAKETRAPEGYVLDSTAKSIAIKKGDAQTLTFYNEPTGSLVIIKRDSETNLPLKGATFQVVTTTGEYVPDLGGKLSSNGLYTTDDKGEIRITGLSPVSLVVKETKAPDGYLLDDTPQTVKVEADDTQTLTFYDIPEQTLTIHKFVKGTQNPIKGATFQVTDQDGKPVGSSNGEFITDETGSIVVSGLKPGMTVNAKETKAAEGYVLNDTPKSIVIRRGDAQTLNFYNEPAGTLVILKKDSATGQPLKGATFQVTTAAGAFVDNVGGRLSSNGLYTTDDKGEIRITGLSPDVLVVKETKAPAGYILDDTPQTVRVNPNDTQTLTFFDSPTQRLVIQKYASGTTTPLQGVVFLVRTIDGANVGPNQGEYTTDRNGQIVLTDLTPGTIITAREVRAANGYQLDGTPQTIQVAGGEAQTMTFFNRPLANLIVQKIDCATGNPLSGAQFRITDAAGKPVTGYTGATANNGVFTTDANGQITLNHLQPGAYVVTETKAPEGYIISTLSQTVALGVSETRTATFTNAPLGSLVIEKFDSLTREPLAGAEFRVTTADGTLVSGGTGGVWTTNANGQAVLTRLDPGSYIVTEVKAPENYQLNSRSHTVTVRANAAVTAAFDDAPLAALTIRKIDAKTKNALSGAVFLVKDSSGQTIGTSNGVYVTGEDGTVIVSGLKPNASIVVTETQAPAGYVLNDRPQTIQVRSGANNSLTFENQPTGTLAIHKYIDGTRNEPISGVAFRVVDGAGAAIGPNDGIYYTDQAGEIEIPGLTPGITVKAQEIRAADDFVLNGTPQDIRIKGGELNLLTFWNQRQGTLVIRKHDSETGNPLPGVEFRVSYADGRPADTEGGRLSSGGQYFTDSSGEITITGITGTFVVEEIATIPGYVMGSDTRKTVTVSPDDTQTLTFTNDPTQSLTIEKYVKGTTTPIPGAAFLVTDGDGRPVGSNGGEYTTDENGRIVVPNLNPGTTVTAKEIRAAAGYVLDGMPKSATIRKGTASTLTFYNEPTQTLTVFKYVKDSTTPIPGTEFLISDSTGAAIGSSGGRYVTDENGRIVLTGLTPGMTVTARESRAADGFVLDTTPKSIAIKSGEAQSLVFYDTPRQSLTVQKYAAGTTTPISGAAFLVTSSEGTTIGSGNGEYTTDANGRFVIYDLTPGITVTVREIRAAAGYVLDGTPQTIRVRDGEAQSLTFYNRPMGSLVVRKLDAATREPLAGAEFRITTDSGSAVTGFTGSTSNNGVFTTDADGQITLNRLQPGTYLVTETKAPEGYVLSSQTQTVRLEAAETKTLTFTNEAKAGIIIRKLDSVTGETLSGAQFRVTTANGTEVTDRDGNALYTTNNSGQIVLSGLSPAAYIVTETKAPDGYHLDSTPQTVTVTASETRTVEFSDTPLASVTILKRDAVTKTPLAGAEFLVKDSGGSPIGPNSGVYTTGEDGTVTVSGLAPNTTLVISETRAPNGYTLGGNAQTVQLRSGQDNRVTFENQPQAALVIRKFVAGTDNEPIAGVEFKVTDSTGAVIGPDNGVYTTDRSGEIRITGLSAGTTVIARETKAAAGFVLDGTPQEIRIQSGQVQQLTFWNRREGSLVVRKLDAATRKPLEGVEFKITFADGRTVDTEGGKLSSNGQYFTDKNGEIVISGVTGTLVITEVETLPGYLIDEASRRQTVVVNADDTQTITLFNPPAQSLTIQKFIRGTSTPIQGARFLITDSRGNVIGPNNGEYTTDENGRIVIADLEPGVTVTAKEVEAPDGYALDSTPKSIAIREGQAQTLTFYDDPVGALVIVKRDKKTGQPLSGATFQITTSNGQFVGNNGGKLTSNGQYTTNESGEIRVTGLEKATLVVKEIKAPRGYQLDDTPQTVDVGPNDTQTLTFYDVPEQSLTIQKFIEGTSTPIKGVTFLVTDNDGKPVGSSNGEFITDDTGSIVLTGLTPGSVITARETKAAAGYVLDGQPKSITIRSGEAQVLRFYNSPKGVLVIEKRDKTTNQPLSGATFQITTAGGAFVDNAGGRLSSNGQYTTDANGQIILTDLNPDTLVVKEIKAPNGYVLDATPQTVKVNTDDTQTLTFYDTPNQTLTILKLAENTNTPLQGVVFLVTAGDGSVVGPNNGLYTTDANGRISISGLTPGTNVTVRESRTISGYQLDAAPQSIQIKSGEAQQLTFYNKPVEPPGALIIKKMDASTKAPLSGVTFKVTRADGSVVGAANGEYRTDETGLVTIRNLDPGTYVVREVQAKDGYLLDDTAKTIEIRDRQTYTLEFFNTAKGGLIVHKLDSVTKEPLAGVQFKITYADGSFVEKGSQGSNGLYTTDRDGQIVIRGISGTVVVTEQKTIDGYKIDQATRTQTVEVKPDATQTVTVYNDPIGGVEIIKVNQDDRAQRIPNVTFELRKVDGGLVKTVTTGQNGRVYASLDAGAYYAVEIETAKGYKLDATPQYFDVKDGKTTTLTVTNKAFSGILIHKTDSSTGKGIYGVTFLLYNAGKNPVRQYVSDQNGYVYIDDLPESGRYYLRELENPGYVLDTQMKTVYVEAGQTIEVDWKNAPITGQIQVYKYAAEENTVTGTAAGAPLQGAVYEVVNVRSGQVMEQIATDARGVAASSPLPLGRYQVKEVTAPAYWQIDGTVHDVTIEYPAQIIKVSAFDKPAQLGVTITKTGNKEVLAGDKMLYRFTVANTSNVPLSSFFWHDKLPYDVTTGDAVTTGIYSARLNYRVLYKTNYNDYRVLAGNLLSTNNYALPLSSLPLQEGEVVTDIQFDFGTVPAGFHSTTQPTLTVSVSGKATNGYRVTNRCDAGGKYGETWETGNAGWTTVVRRLAPKPTKPLPKTGY